MFGINVTKSETGASLSYLIEKNINNIKSVLFPVLLKVCLGMLKSQSSKLKGLSALLQRSKALPMRHASSTLFLVLFGEDESMPRHNFFF